MAGGLELLRLIAKVPRLAVDNPGGQWLAAKRAANLESGTNQFGAPVRMGPITGSFRADEGEAKLLLPVKKLAQVKGLSGEQQNVRPADLDWLVEYMRTHGRLPPPHEGSASEYAPFVTVDQTGRPWMSEGNHRTMAAERLGWDYLPTEVRYFSGGEGEAGGFDPEILLNWHRKNYDTRRYARGGLAQISRRP